MCVNVYMQYDMCIQLCECTLYIYIYSLCVCVSVGVISMLIHPIIYSTVNFTPGKS